MKSLLLYLMLIVTVGLTGCASLLKCAVNKRFPPVSSTDKKLKSVCAALNNIDTTKEYHALLNVSTVLVDTIAKAQLSKENGLIITKQSDIDTIKINAFKASSEVQAFSISSKQDVFIKHNKYIKRVDFELTGSMSPFYSKDTIFFNPYFNRIHIRKIYFKKWLFLTRFKPLNALLNSVFNNYLDNLNGSIKNYNIILRPLPADGIKVSSLLRKTPEVIVEHDAMLSWKQKDFISAIMIDDFGINCIILDKEDVTNPDNYLCSKPKGTSETDKKELLKKEYTVLHHRFNYTVKSSFDSLNNNTPYLAKIQLSSKYLERNLNYAFHNLDFRFSYPAGYQLQGLYSDVTIHKPQFNCGCKEFCRRLVGGGLAGLACRVACNAGGSGIPVVGPFLVACETADLLWPDNYTIGSVRGNLDATGIVKGTLNDITFTNSLKNVAITKDLSIMGNLKYDFNFSALNHFSIGRLLFAMSSGCVRLDLNGSPAVTGSIKNNFDVSLTQKQDNDKSFLQIDIKPFTANIELNESPGLQIVNNYRNYFTCGIVYKAVGLALVLGQFLPSSVIPTKFENYFNALTKGRYDHEFTIKSIVLPLDYQLGYPLVRLEANTFWGVKSITAIALYSKYQASAKNKGTKR